ncbi:MULTISPECIES: hypothetical protein [unclassified Streptomyces]|uniref:hypothetical protein n=1 Tax=unclassified Streptomyces TaxID=2593676 RepID=UPI002DDA7DFC|nr:hypothetical protein [Streptomyces sp. NBC_01750]WSB03059.1 hypothetical protein OIE54_29590 [Streptomyces sp. NBC_01794]WSD32695.1 hypothetical protein OG966_12675 [Streptomyces sp. NBC_01750]
MAHTASAADREVMKRSWLLLALPVLPLILISGLLLRRRAEGRGGPGGGPPSAGVREPRRPKPSPPAAAVALHAVP